MEKRKLLDNALWLAVLSAGNIVFPLIVTPFLVRKLGINAFGYLSIASSLALTLSAVPSFSFSWTATGEIAKCHGRIWRQSAVYSTVVQTQALLGLAAAVLYLGVALAKPDWRAHWAIFFPGILTVIFFPLLCDWLFQGLQKVRFLTLVFLAVRFLHVPLILWLVRTPRDAPLASWLQATPSLVSAVFIHVFLRRQLRLRLYRTTSRRITRVLREGFGLWLSRVSIVAYTTANPVLVGAFAGPAAAAVYSVAERLRSVAYSAIMPLSQAAYPIVSKTEARESGSSTRLAAGVLLFNLAGALGALAGAALTVGRVLPAMTLPATLLNRATLLLVFGSLLPIAFSNVFGYLILLPRGGGKAFSRILAASSVLSMVAVPAAAYACSALGAALAQFLVEAVIATTMGVVVARLGLSLKMRDFLHSYQVVTAWRRRAVPAA